MFSKQKVYCNCCGKEMNIELNKVFGREFRCCSKECISEMNWRVTLSNMGQKYKPRTNAEEK